MIDARLDSRAFFFALAAAPALWPAAAFAGAAQAAERPAPANHCAQMYGEGFAPLAGSPVCVRIGGRVRVEAGAGASSGWRVAPEVGSASRAASPGMGGLGMGGSRPMGAPHPMGGPSHVRVPRNF